MEYDASFDSRIGYHLRDPIDLATHRHTLNIEKRLKLGSNFSVHLGARARVEGAFASNETRYGNSEAVHKQSAEVMPRNIFLEYKNNGFNLRAGQQQTVWGEAFGFYFADIVNPKDLREIGLGDLESNRLPVPMLNVRWNSDAFGLQALYIPKPFFHQVPSQGSDFFPFSDAFPTTAITLDDQRTLPLEFSNGEVGTRATALVSGLDLSLFGFYYYDRLANYTPRATVQGMTFDARHERIFSAGTTATYDFSPFLVRAEGIYTKDRYYDALSGGSLVSQKSDELIGVVEVDYTQIESWRFGAQIAHTHLIEDLQPLLVGRDTFLVSLLANGKTWREHSLDFIATYAPKDGSSLLRASYNVPMSDQVEVSLSGDLLSGSLGSSFGRYRSGSRIFVTVKAFLSS